MDQLTDVLNALSHPTRRAIIRQLANGPARFLDRAGLIERRKQGREVIISFRAEPLREVATWVLGYDRFWNERLDQFEQFFKDKTKTTKNKEKEK